MKTTAELKWELLQEKIKRAKLDLTIAAIRNGSRSKSLPILADRLRRLCERARVMSKGLGLRVVAEILREGKS